MYIPKRYGQSRVEECPFCGKQGVTKNDQGIPVCLDHKKEQLLDVKCSCGQWLDVKNGKYGVFFSCMKCGNMNLRKVLEINQTHKEKQIEVKKEKKQTITITSDDPLYFD